VTNIPRFYPESDGGPVDGREYPKTFYVVDRLHLLSRMDCNSRREARKLADILNQREGKEQDRERRQAQDRP